MVSFLDANYGRCAPDHKSRILATLRALRSFTLDDDIRTEFGKAHENCRYLVEEEGLIPVALALIKGDLWCLMAIILLDAIHFSGY